MYLVYDVETSGLPRYQSYDTARVVSIAWQLLDNNFEIMKQAYYVVKPEGFVIPWHVSKIHGIETSFATKTGCTFDNVIHDFMNDVSTAQLTIAHNISFDFNVILNELMHRNMERYVEIWKSKKQYCTMRGARVKLMLKKNPKLTELYQMLYNNSTIYAHNARYDTIYCSLCFVHLINN